MRVDMLCTTVPCIPCTGDISLRSSLLAGTPPRVSLSSSRASRLVRALASPPWALSNSSGADTRHPAAAAACPSTSCARVFGRFSDLSAIEQEDVAKHHGLAFNLCHG